MVSLFVWNDYDPSNDLIMIVNVVVCSLLLMRNITRIESMTTKIETEKINVIVTHHIVYTVYDWWINDYKQISTVLVFSFCCVVINFFVNVLQGRFMSLRILPTLYTRLPAAVSNLELRPIFVFNFLKKWFLNAKLQKFSASIIKNFCHDFVSIA